MKDLLNKIHHSRAEDLMLKFSDNIIDLTVTSPPYDDLRKYEGYEFDFETIAKELFRVTALGGVVVWVVGDATVNGSETCTSFKHALFFKEIGFNLHDTMIYMNYRPPLSHRRYEQCFDYMFIFSKGAPKTFNPIMERKLNIGNRRIKSYQRNKDNSKSLGCSSDKEYRIKQNIWRKQGVCAPNDAIAAQHPAIFPEVLAADHIRSWSNENDIVFDPCSGSGTTSKMATLLNRQFIACDMSEKYVVLSQERIQPYLDQGKLF